MHMPAIQYLSVAVQQRNLAAVTGTLDGSLVVVVPFRNFFFFSSCPSPLQFAVSFMCPISVLLCLIIVIIIPYSFSHYNVM